MRARPWGWVLTVAAALLVLSPRPGVSQSPQVATFSVLACDRARGVLGIAVQSKHVSAGAIVPAAEAGTGAVATQAAANVRFKPEGLKLLRQGLSPEEVARQFHEMDDEIHRRQFAVAAADCAVTAFTGDSTVDWKGHRTGDGFSVQGNMLTGPEVIDAMAEAWISSEESELSFGQRLIGVLEAAQEAGGDKRGRQAAGLLIVREGGGFLGGDDRYVDIRVDDHPIPIQELKRVYDVYMREEHPDDYRDGEP